MKIKKDIEERNISRSRSASNGMDIFEKVFKAVSKIPKGKVSTYGDIARYIGISNPRVVGFALHVNKDPDNIPCHRVVNKKGRLAPGYAFGGLDVQKHILKQEGLEIIDNYVDLTKYLFTFKGKDSLNTQTDI